MIVLMKLSAPGNGPGLDHFSAYHMLMTVFYSLGIWIFIWIKFLFFSLLEIGSIETIAISLLISIASMLMLIFCFRHEKFVLATIKYQPESNTRSINFSKRYLLYFGICFFICAYLPNYIWSIASRHNYLPSIGVSIIIASLLDILISKKCSSKVKIIAIFLFGLTSFNFSYLNILEKNFWIKSYEFRSSLYRHLAEIPPNLTQKTLIFSEFPSSLFPSLNLHLPKGIASYLRLMIGSIAPPPSFLFYEQPTAFSMYSKGSSTFEIISWHPIQTKEGFIIKNERRWGYDSMIFVPKNDAVIVRYGDYKDDPAFAHHPFAYNHTYSKVNPPLKISSTPIKPNFSATKDKSGYVISIPNVDLPKNSVLAIVPISNPEHRNTPVMFTDAPWNDEEYQLPIEIATSFDNKSPRGTYKLSLSDRMSNCKAFKLISISQIGSTFISKTEIKN